MLARCSPPGIVDPTLLWEFWTCGCLIMRYLLRLSAPSHTLCAVSDSPLLSAYILGLGYSYRLCSLLTLHRAHARSHSRPERAGHSDISDISSAAAKILCRLYSLRLYRSCSSRAYRAMTIFARWIKSWALLSLFWCALIFISSPFN